MLDRWYFDGFELKVAVRFEMRFHREILAADFSFNPALGFEEIGQAVAENVPAPVLPQPWPPSEACDQASQTMLALTKMKHGVAFRTVLPELDMAALSNLLREWYPQVWEMDAGALKAFDAHVSLAMDGNVRSGFTVPEEGDFPYPLWPPQHREKIPFIVPMLVFGMQRMLEEKRVEAPLG